MTPERFTTTHDDPTTNENDPTRNETTEEDKLTIFPRTRVGYEMIDSQRGSYLSLWIFAGRLTIVVLKTPPRY